jgi:hypothetical protein
MAYPSTANDTVASTAGGKEDLTPLEDVLADYKTAWTYTQSYYHRLWEDCWKIYSNQRVKIGYESVASTFVPVTFQAIEMILGAVAGGKPRFDYIPTNITQNQDTKVLNALADYFWERGNMAIKVIPWVRDSLLYGTGVLYVSWEIDHPEFKNIPLKDFFIDPAATTLENAKYCGYRYLTTKKSLKEAQTVDPETGKIIPLYKNLDDLQSLTSKGDNLTEKEQKDLYLGSTLGKDAKEKQVECIYYITPDKLIVVANRKTIIREENNPYYRPAQGQSVETKGFYPFAIQRNYIDPALFYGKGDVEPIIDAQELLNDTANQKIDNISYVLDNMWALDPAYAHLKDEIESVPGGVITAPKDAITPIAKPVVNHEAELEMEHQKTVIMDTTGAGELLPPRGRVSATQVSYLNSLSRQRFSMKTTTMENEGFKQFADIIFKMAQIFVDVAMAVRVVGPQGTDWKAFHKDDYKGSYEPRIQLEASAKAEKEATAAKFQNLYQILLQNPMVNQQELLAMLMDKVFDLDDIEAATLLNVPPPEGPPHPPLKIIENISYKDAPPDIQRQMEAEAGLQPSQMGVPVATAPPGMGPHPHLPTEGPGNPTTAPPGNQIPMKPPSTHAAMGPGAPQNLGK